MRPHMRLQRSLAFLLGDRGELFVADECTLMSKS